VGPWGNTNLKGTAPRRTAAVIAYGTRRCAVASDMGDGGTAAAGLRLGPQLASLVLAPQKGTRSAKLNNLSGLSEIKKKKLWAWKPGPV
jgi:hypothetical protein